jgi:hypothetical protein
MLVALVSGCAKYRAQPLDRSSAEFAGNAYTKDGVTLMVKAFNKADCERYLDRDVLKKGYQPLQITIQNNTDRNLIVTKDCIDLTLASNEDVAKTVETSTVGRATGYGVAALFIWPFAIPAIVDGVKSSNANEQLTADFQQKAIREQIVLPHTRFTGLVFAPIATYKVPFAITLIDKDTREAIQFNVAPTQS